MQKINSQTPIKIPTIESEAHTSPDHLFIVQAAAKGFEVIDDPDYVFADRVGQKYGADLRAFDVDNPHRVVVTLKPVRVNAVDMRAAD